MSQHKMKWLTFFLAVCPVGCIPFVLPSYSLTPPVSLEDAGPVIHAFRADITRHSGHGFHCLVNNERWELTQIPFGDNCVPGQNRLGLTTGLAYTIGAYTTSESLAILLYRPGYELVTTKSWELFPTVQWKEVSGVEAQARVLDELFPNSITVRLEPGSRSDNHCKALRFGAAEYERLIAQAQLVAAPTALIQDFEAKAKALRDLAAHR